jgi:Mg2+ and Co2+ transporter CorA
MPAYDPILKTSRKAEIDFLITKNKVITVHYEDLEPVNNLARNFTNNLELKENDMATTNKLVYSLIEEMIHFSMRQLRHIEENVTKLTHELFMGKEESMLREISYAKRNLLDYTIVSRPQEILLNSLKEVGIKFWGGEDVAVYFSDLIGDHMKVTQHMENYQNTIESLEETNSQLLNAKTNAVMQKFNVLAFLTIPILIVLQLFGVESFVRLFGGDDLKVFITSIITIIIISIISLIIFRKKRWL